MSLSSRSTTHQSQPSNERRGLFRRSADMALRKAYNQQAHQLKSLLELGQLIGSDLRLEPMLYQVAQKASDLMKKIDPLPVGTQFFQTMGKHLTRLSEIQKEADTIIRLTQEQETGNLSTELKETWDKIESQCSIPLTYSLTPRV
jgi:hypothetical protein